MLQLYGVTTPRALLPVTSGRPLTSPDLSEFFCKMGGETLPTPSSGYFGNSGTLRPRLGNHPIWGDWVTWYTHCV